MNTKDLLDELLRRSYEDGSQTNVIPFRRGWRKLDDVPFAPADPVDSSQGKGGPSKEPQSPTETSE